MSVLAREFRGAARSRDTGWTEAVAILEPTFHIEDDDRGRFMLGGRQFQLVLEPDGWLLGMTPLGGAPDRWFARQARIRTLAKIVKGPRLQADVPIQASPGAAFEALRAILCEAIGGLAAGPATSPEGLGAAGADDGAIAELLGAYAASSPWRLSTEADSFTLLVETARGRQQRVTAKLGEGRLRLVAAFGLQRARGAASSRALAHFLLALNARLRLVRGVAGDEGVLLEAVLPTWMVNVDLVDRAIGALVVGAATARRECAALLVPAVADSYCAFHGVEPLSRERAADAHSRASSRERGVP